MVVRLAEDSAKEFLHINIDLPAFQVELTTSDPVKALSEIRQILEQLEISQEVVYEEFVADELKSVFSDTFIQNQQVMGSIKKLLKQEEDYRVSTAEIPVMANLESTSRQVTKKEVQHAIANITRNVEPTLVKQGIVHINGELDKESKLFIVDHIHKYMPTAQLRAFHSKGVPEKVVVECIFFGDFPEAEED